MPVSELPTRIRYANDNLRLNAHTLRVEYGGVWRIYRTIIGGQQPSINDSIAVRRLVDHDNGIPSKVYIDGIWYDVTP